MRVMTFNLRMNTPDDGPNAWPYRLQLIQQLITGTLPGILGVQELLPSMLTDFETILPGYSWIGEPRREGDERVAIFFKQTEFEVLTSRTFWLSETPGVPGSLSWQSSLPRVCTYAVFRDIGQRHPLFSVFNTHLDHQSESARVNGLRVVLSVMKEVIEEFKINHTILMGDFNDVPSSQALESVEGTELSNGLNLFSSYHAMKTPSVGKTFHGFEGGQVGAPIDYIFLSKTFRINTVTIHRDTLEGRHASDHYAVSVDASPLS